MKLSEMTNEELAKELMSRVPLDSDRHDDIREAAARLRKADDAVKDARATCTDEKCPFDFPEMSKTNAELRRRLRVAEDALSIARDFTKWTAIHAENELWQTIRDKAIETEFNMNHPECAEIREEGTEASGESEVKG